WMRSICQSGRPRRMASCFSLRPASCRARDIRAPTSGPASIVLSRSEGNPLPVLAHPGDDRIVGLQVLVGALETFSKRDGGLVPEHGSGLVDVRDRDTYVAGARIDVDGLVRCPGD